jgi:hypothetical protein
MRLCSDGPASEDAHYTSGTVEACMHLLLALSAKIVEKAVN